ncbi:transcriptional regulator, partial [bacterium M00.F.Ca.ET.155.01.1.1]
MDSKIVNLRTKLEIYKAGSGGGNLADCPVRDVIQG